MKKAPALILFLFALISTTSACGEIAKQTEVVQPKPTYEYVSTTNIEIVFAGKVVNPNNGEWANDRLVLAFLKSKEIARAITSTLEYTATIVPISFVDPNSNSVPMMSPLEAFGCSTGGPCPAGTPQARFDGNLGISDGIFVLRIPNTYELNLSNLGTPSENSPFIQINEGDGKDRLGIWTDPINEGDFHEYYIPSKNIHYVVVVLPGDLSQLPAEIQQPGSVKLLDGNRLVVANPNLPDSTQKPSSIATKFEQVEEIPNELSRSVFPINNCGGVSNITQEITHTYIHEIIDETSGKLGIEIPLLDWLKIVAEVEKKYGTNDKEITTYSTTLIVPSGKNIEYTVLRKQIWENGVAIIENGGIEISAAYRILKNEIFEVAK